VEVMPGVLLGSGIAACVLALLDLQRSHELARVLRTIEPHRAAADIDPPPVSILAPCRGVDDHFEAYVRALLSQGYVRYEVLFLVESTTDPAWSVLDQILAAAPATRASLIVTGTAEGCSQKIHNLLVGWEHVAPETSIVAFVDSDVQVHPGWLGALVTPLADAVVGATSGYRWYVPSPGSVAGGLRSAWNAATLGLMAHPRYGFAWGGSSAIRRQVFEELRIRDAWARGLSDDLLLTRAVRAAGLKIPFVAACLVPTFEPCTWGQLLEWTNRQARIARVYAPHSWGAGLAVHLTSLTLGGLGLLAASTGQWFASGLLLSYWAIQGLGILTVCRAALQRLSRHGFSIAQRAWTQTLWAPLVMALALVNIAASLTIRTITWRGISYTMLSAQHVVVHRKPRVPTPFSQAS
jgi:cellulose synthase/poly-beta-1,6-N-acetylglucosamine synthase-like glycosyltransferase